MPGYLNDITVVESLLLLSKDAFGESPLSYVFQLNSVRWNKSFWFADGIYSRWPLFLSSTGNPKTRRTRSTHHLKNLSRGTLSERLVLSIVCGIARLASQYITVETTDKILRCLFILHNSCVKKRLEEDDELREDTEESRDSSVAVGKKTSLMWGGLVQFSSSTTTPKPDTVAALCEVSRLMKEKVKHALMKSLPVSHIWNSNGGFAS